MKKNSGFTLIELIIVVSIIGIILSIILPMFGVDTQSNYDFECIDGLKFTRDYDDGDLEQVLGPNGGGVSCQ